WESDDENVARVSQDGIVQAVAAGTTTVRATWGKHTDVISVQVSEEVIVPDLIGKTKTEALGILTPLGLTLNAAQAAANDPGSKPDTVISQAPAAHAPLAKGGVVNVALNPHPYASIGIKAEPDKPAYPLGNEITFIEDVEQKNPNNTYVFKWHVDGREAGSGATFNHAFTTPGPHYVQLVMESSDPKENDAIIKNISVEYPPDMEARIGFRPETNVYPIGSTVGFEAQLTNDTADITEYRWYVAGGYVGSGKQGVRHTFPDDGQYEIKLGLRRGSNFDEVKVTRPLTVGEAGIGTLGRERNRFEAQGAPDNLEILSSYWVGGDGKWSKPFTFNGGSIGPVDHYILYTGAQVDGYNTGFLVYAPRGKNELLFKVFHFSWADAEGRMPHGTVHYSGPLPLHNKTIVPASVAFTRQSSRLCEIEWRTADDSVCRARIGKFRKTDQDAFSGLTDLGCEYDNAGWKTQHAGPHGSICPKADQWSTSGGGFMVMNGSHRFDKHWFRLSGSTPEGPYYLNGEDTKSPPQHALAEVTKHVKIKQGTVTVRGPGALAYYLRRKSSSPYASLFDATTGQRFFPQTGGDQTMYQARNWVFKGGRWDGEWIGDFKGNVHDLYGDRPMSGWVPAGQIKTLEVFIEQGWHFVGGVAGFHAPSEIEYELWFFPREGGGVKVETEPIVQPSPARGAGLHGARP
ncbi:MAG: PKD domain-containing protein, partial [Verrucomicrobia bacterium]|nr:PKD domain-containing protein [Verrucomicrobiota bacterium]